MMKAFTFPAIFILLITGIFFSGCEKKNDPVTPPQENWEPTPYEITVPAGFPHLPIPEDNPTTVEGIELGRRLFYDPILSADNTQSCASCHAQDFNFTDHGERFSSGINGEFGTRNAMSVINAGWMTDLFWDGRKKSLEEQALEPVTNPIEMHETWANAASKLMEHPDYPDLFFKAFGTRNIDSSLVVKAIAQFERTLISSDSKWDRYLKGEVQLSQAETRGYEIFFTEKGDCFHCHATILYTDNLFHNNGLDSIYSDRGLSDVTGDPQDLGKFKTPTLRNIKYTAPYMHDGRFNTLEEVIDFYSHNLINSPTIDPLMKKVGQGGVQLTEGEKEDLIAFILTLTDTTFVNNPDYSDPFEN